MADIDEVEYRKKQEKKKKKLNEKREPDMNVDEGFKSDKLN